MKISTKLRQLVKASIDAGQTRYSIAKTAGVDYASFVRWLDHDRDIRAATVDALGELLGAELIGPNEKEKVVENKPKPSPAAKRPVKAMRKIRGATAEQANTKRTREQKPRTQ